MKNGVENPCRRKQRGRSNDDAPAINSAVVRSHPNFPRGHWQMNFDANWTGLLSKRFVAPRVG
jgi:hypothetical protein